MKWIIFCLLLPCFAHAQSAEVLPEELSLEVIVQETTHTPILGEMVLITIRGAYRRHITLEKLEQPDLSGFNWTQLGPDRWSDQRIDGRKVKILERRMALYPKRAGLLTIGPFVHHLTLTDAGDDWFEHDIKSRSVTIDVAPIPPEARDQWWFPTHAFQITDQWSNAPDQLNPGDGVLRVIHLQATGATPDMIPPMPKLNSPSGMVFAHPEKRLMELSPNGPVTHAFWRWTLRPTNDISAVLEPINVPFFDTQTRTHQTAVISAQRVAYTRATLPQITPVTQNDVRLPGWQLAGFGLLIGATVVMLAVRNSAFAGLAGMPKLPRFLSLIPAYLRLRRAARNSDFSAFRRDVQRLCTHSGATPDRVNCLDVLDRNIFSPKQGEPVNLRAWVWPVLRTPHPNKQPHEVKLLQL